MDLPVQHRRFIRYQFVESPILIEIPELSPVMIEPVNISWGGFEVPEEAIGELGAKVSLPEPLRRPEPGMSLDCDLEVLKQVFPGLAVEVPWAAAEREEASWTLGVRIFVPEDQRARFWSAMKHSFSMLRPEE